MQDLSLAKIDAVCAAIEAATTVQEIKGTLDAAAACQIYIQQAKIGKEAELKITEYIIRAERKLGEMLQAAKAAGQITHAHKGDNLVVDSNDNKVTLEQIGISRDLSSRAQRTASVPKAQFEKAINAGKKAQKLSRNMFFQKTNDGKESKRGISTPQLDKARQIVRELLEAGKPISPHKLEKEHDISHVTFDMAITAEIARKQALDNPPIDRATLSVSAQQKLECAIKQEKERLAAQYWRDVNVRVQAKVDEVLGEKIRKMQEQYDFAKRTLEHRRGVMTRKQYNQIRACLHTDKQASDQEKNDAFILFTSFEASLLKEAEHPVVPQMTGAPPLPKTAAEWEALKRQATEGRRHKPESKTTVVSKRKEVSK